MEAHEPKPLGAERDQRDLFPFPQAREGQGQFLEDARSCMLNRVDLLADAPTGLGKTAVGLSASLEAVLPKAGRPVPDRRQSQHRAAIETSVTSGAGRGSRWWTSSPSRTRASAVVGTGIPCAGAGDCYFLDRDRVETAAQTAGIPIARGGGHAALREAGGMPLSRGPHRPGLPRT